MPDVLMQEAGKKEVVFVKCPASVFGYFNLST
jgi:hypothetical protein